ncbi:MAG: carbon starvation protein A [Firmicutes bacterium]|nr:carbon starvation protein A [Bacillota bacterium]MCL5038525.1 carbon starvation protein A [Bacillota bacterium]
MNVAILLLLTVPIFYLGYQLYSGFISRVFGLDDNRKTPALDMRDGVDYVPTKLGVAFSHHFASIAGAGPIVGPTAALLYGYAPAWLWIILGGVFLGAVHDYASLFISLREKGRSMAQVAESSMGRFGFFLFIAFTLVMIVLVTSAFLGLTATALTSLVPLKELRIEGSTVLHTVVKDGVQYARIGGIASTSVLVMTFFAPLVGYLLYKRDIKVWLASLLALVVGALAIITGIYYPLAIDAQTWMQILTVYVFLAAGIPVWMLLQPRDFTNSFILYAGIAALFLGVLGGGLTGVSLQAPAWNLAGGTAKMGSIWPFLFITIACGAISGFHSLVAGGTVSKQVEKESHARMIGYGGMLLESLLAVVVVLSVASGIRFETYLNIVYPAKGASNPILAFSLSMGGLLHQGLGLPVTVGTVFGILMVEGFVITTLDTAVRLNRYLFEELWGILFTKPHPVLKSYLFNAALSVGLMYYLAAGNKFLTIWPIFGSANQLLAALALIAASVWLGIRRKPNWFTIIPAIFMMVTTLMALYQLLLGKYLPSGNMPLVVTDVLLMVLSVGVIALAVSRLVINNGRAASEQVADD